MNTSDLLPNDPSVEALHEGGTWLLDLVAAVDHLRRGIRPGFTVWDAVEEALRWHTAAVTGTETVEPNWDDPDPLRTTVARFVATTTGTAAVDAQVGIRPWALTMAARYNAGNHWPHPTPRRTFPPPLLAVELADDDLS